MNKNEKWDRRFLEMSLLISSWSKDPRTQVGSVIVSDRRRVVSVGYNGFPRHIEDRGDWLEDRETKHLFVAHAERNALDNAECSVVGSTVYTTLFPCNECAKSIIQRGITRVVSFKFSNDEFQRFNYDQTLFLLKAASTEITLYEKI